MLFVSSNKQHQAIEMLECGCTGFIQKPFSMKEISQKSREILDRE
jgi:DNA-binding response OmpR family regulator